MIKNTVRRQKELQAIMNTGTGPSAETAFQDSDSRARLSTGRQVWSPPAPEALSSF
jgi:hypothetical protein